MSTLTLHTNLGAIQIELDHKNTPVTSQNFLDYVKEGFYDGLIFHRVIKNFMIQGGGFKPGMQHKSARSAIENEADKGEKHLRGTLAMARTSDPHSASSQFFINVVDNHFLNHTQKSPQGWGYCVFGKVISGMDVVDSIQHRPTTSRAGHQDVPIEDVIIEKITFSEEK
ncbi:MAG: peptidyl-prolyl cis-trans isomerase [Gammaproteobacteria bacterium]|nr:peptidyl-prolyl cis-trans isomerase [Gammaproteobacteria bacterium]